MSFLSDFELKDFGFKKIGKNCKISSKASFYFPNQISIGDNSRIDDFCVLSGKIEIGNNVHIANSCILYGGPEGIFINDFSGFAWGVRIIAGSDDYYGRAMIGPQVPKEFTNQTFIKVKIEKHVIVGTNSIIMPGVKLKTGTSVLAMSLIKYSTEPWKIYSGNPANIIGSRSKDVLEYEKKFHQLKI
jgi:galactoside O-acetyltransferase